VHKEYKKPPLKVKQVDEIANPEFEAPVQKVTNAPIFTKTEISEAVSEE
jgi:hypothetical protein